MARKKLSKLAQQVLIGQAELTAHKALKSVEQMNPPEPVQFGDPRIAHFGGEYDPPPPQWATEEGHRQLQAFQEEQLREVARAQRQFEAWS